MKTKTEKELERELEEITDFNWMEAISVTRGTNKITCPFCLYQGCSNWGKSVYTKGKTMQRYKCLKCGKLFTFGFRKVFFDKRLAKQEFNKKVEELKDKINAVYQDLVQWYNTHYPNFVLRKRGFEKILKRIEKIDKIFNSEKEENHSYPLNNGYDKRGFLPSELPKEK